MSYLCFLVIMIILSLVSVVFSLIAPIMVQIWSKSVEGITIYRILLLSIIMAVFMLINILFIVIKERYSRKLNRENFFDYLKDILTLKYDYIISEGIMKILDKTIMSVNNIYLFITGDNIKLITNSLVMLIVSVWILYINKYIFLACLIVIPINILGFAKINKVLLEKSRNMELQVTTGWQKVLSVISNTEYIKQKSNPDIIKNYLSGTVDTIYNSMSDVNMYSVSTSTLIHSINSIFQTVILTYGVYNFAFVGHDYFSLMILMILIPTFFNTLSSLVGSKLNKRNFTIAKEFKDNLEKMSEVYSGNNLEEIKNISFNISELKLPTHSIDVNIVGEFSKGDIIRIKGDSGRGKSTFLKSIIGFRENDGIFINGKEVSINSPQDAIREGIGYLSEDRKRFGCIVDMTIANNTVITNLDKYIKAGLIDDGAIVKASDQFVQSLHTKTPSSKQLVRNLSGGNQQKVVIAKWLEQNSDILIFDEPTRGIDVGAKSEIYTLMNDLVAQGKSIIMISSELTEILRMSDRIVVMCEGRKTGELDISQATQERILALATDR